MKKILMIILTTICIITTNLIVYADDLKLEDGCIIDETYLEENYSKYDYRVIIEDKDNTDRPYYILLADKPITYLSGGYYVIVGASTMAYQSLIPTINEDMQYIMVIDSNGIEYTEKTPSGAGMPFNAYLTVSSYSIVYANYDVKYGVNNNNSITESDEIFYYKGTYINQPGYEEETTTEEITDNVYNDNTDVSINGGMSDICDAFVDVIVDLSNVDLFQVVLGVLGLSAGTIMFIMMKGCV